MYLLLTVSGSQSPSLLLIEISSFDIRIIRVQLPTKRQRHAAASGRSFVRLVTVDYHPLDRK